MYFRFGSGVTIKYMQMSIRDIQMNTRSMQMYTLSTQNLYPQEKKIALSHIVFSIQTRKFYAIRRRKLHSQILFFYSG